MINSYCSKVRFGSGSGCVVNMRIQMASEVRPVGPQKTPPRGSIKQTVYLCPKLRSTCTQRAERLLRWLASIQRARTEDVEGGGPAVVEALLAQERCRRVREHRAEERARERGRHHPAAVRRRRPLVHQHVHRRQRRALRTAAHDNMTPAQIENAFVFTEHLRHTHSFKVLYKVFTVQDSMSVSHCL